MMPMLAVAEVPAIAAVGAATAEVRSQLGDTGAVQSPCAAHE
jgi:hypothetical protein